VKDVDLYQLNGVRVTAWDRPGGGSLMLVGMKDWQKITNDGVRVLVMIICQSDCLEHYDAERNFAVFQLSVDAEGAIRLVREILQQLKLAGALGGPGPLLIGSEQES